MTSTKLAASMAQKAASLASDNKAGILTGATTANLPNVPELPAGGATEERAPGYYSNHTSKIRVGNKVYPWPMGTPFVPSTPEQEAVLESLLERGLAVRVVKAEEESE